MDKMIMTVRGQEYEVTVEVGRDGRDAWFKLRLGGGEGVLASRTWDGLYNQAMTVTKRAKVKVAVPVLEYIYRTNKWREGTATGIHASNGNLMVTWKLGDFRTSNEQVSKFGGTYFAALTEDERAEYARLYKARADAVNAQARFERDYTIDVSREVSDAIEAEVKRQMEAEAASDSH